MKGTRVQFAAPVRPDHRRNTGVVKTHLGPVAERLESLNFNALEFQQVMFPLSNGSGLRLGLTQTPSARGIEAIVRAVAAKVKQVNP